MAHTSVTRHFDAPRDRVYRALIDPDQVARWRFPSEMTCEVHEFDAREGGRQRVSLTYLAADRTGKTVANVDTYRGRFVRLDPGELVVEALEFETDDPSMRGEMTVTVRLSDGERGGTDLWALHADLPSGVSAADNEAGWNESLDRLAELLRNE